jgi:DNA-binding Lrp family transcriptional regulator
VRARKPTRFAAASGSSQKVRVWRLGPIERPRYLGLERPMQCFFVEFQCKLGEAYAVADEIANREIASEIYSVSGQFDLLAKFYIEDDVDIGRFVADHIHTVPGVERTHTILTFKAF